MTSRNLLYISLIAAIGAACSDSTAPESVTPTSPDEINLTVRVHLLESTESNALNSTLTTADVGALMAAVNGIWLQAEIHWNIESIIREEVQNARGFDAAVAGQSDSAFEILRFAFPRENLLEGEWDVFVLRNFGDLAGGVYLPDEQVLFFAELGPVGPQDLAGAGPRILAHELGHSLSLPHVPCPVEGNLMAPGCPGEVRTRLTAEQIVAARRQALTGSPFDGSF